MSPTATLTDHAGHGPWRTVQRCTYCPCGARLYQGTAPANPQEQEELAAWLDRLFDWARSRSQDPPPREPRPNS